MGHCRSMRRQLRGTFAALVFASVLTWSAPAGANDVTISFGCATGTSPTPSPSASPQPSDPDCTPQAGQVVDGTWRIAFTAKAGSFGRLRNVELFIISEEDSVPSPGEEPNGQVPPVEAWGDKNGSDWADVTTSPNAVTLIYVWDTKRLTPYNGKYTIRVRARSHTDGQNQNQATTVERKTIRVDNEPAALAAPQATLSETVVTVTWNAAREPDTKHYIVWRARTDGDDPPSANAYEAYETNLRGTRLVESLTAAGTYWYKVQVARRSVVASDGVIKSSVSPASAGVTHVVTPPPATPGPPTQSVDPNAGVRTPPPRGPVIVSRRPPPVPDAPFSAVLPYEDIPEFEEEPADTQAAGEAVAVEEPEPQDPGSRTGLLPVAIGAFFVSAALALGRAPI